MNRIDIKSFENDGLPEAQIEDLEEIFHDILEGHDLSVECLEVETCHGLKLTITHLGEGDYNGRKVDEWEGLFEDENSEYDASLTFWAWVNA